MESKTRARIIGVIAITGTIFALMPFFNLNKQPLDAISVQPPAFPDQTVQISTAPEQAPAVNAQPATEQNNLQSKSQHPTADQENLLSVVHPSIINNVVTPEAKILKNSDNSAEELMQNRNSVAAPLPDIKAQPSKLIMPATDEKAFVKMASAAWAVQMGSFNNKANALRLVNQLRGQGYKAFIRKTITAMGESTRVFVGPLDKKTSALALANELESALHVRGIIVSYKPLTL